MIYFIHHVWYIMYLTDEEVNHVFLQIPYVIGTAGNMSIDIDLKWMSWNHQTSTCFEQQYDAKPCDVQIGRVPIFWAVFLLRIFLKDGWANWFQDVFLRGLFRCRSLGNAADPFHPFSVILVWAIAMLKASLLPSLKVRRKRNVSRWGWSQPTKNNFGRVVLMLWNKSRKRYCTLSAPKNVVWFFYVFLGWIETAVPVKNVFFIQAWPLLMTLGLLESYCSTEVCNDLTAKWYRMIPIACTRPGKLP